MKAVKRNQYDIDFPGRRLDWLFLWTALFPHALPRHKIILKKDLKFLPGSGWSMQTAGFLFLDRKWENDQSTFDAIYFLFHIHELTGFSFTVLFKDSVEYIKHDGRKVNVIFLSFYSWSTCIL